MKKGLLLIGLVILLLMGSNSAWAHTFTADFDLTLGQDYEIVHQEGTPFGGWVTFDVTNTGTEAWGDFHFNFYEVPGYDITNLHWTNASSSQTLDSFVIDNDVYGATLDLYFYGDPLLPGETGTFEGYSDNQDSLSWFGVAVHPTPVPVPGALWLLLSCVAGIVGLRKNS